MQGAWVQSLVRELRSHKPCSMTKTEREERAWRSLAKVRSRKVFASPQEALGNYWLKEWMNRFPQCDLLFKFLNCFTLPLHLTTINTDNNRDKPGRNAKEEILHSFQSEKSKSSQLMASPGGSDSAESTCWAGDPGPFPGSRRSPGEGNGNPLQYFCWEIEQTEVSGRLQFMGSQSQKRLSD